MNEVSIADFKKLDIRIGTIIDARTPGWSHWVVKLEVDFGKDIGKRTIFAGVLGFYEPSDLINKQFPFIVNMQPKKIGPEGDVSEGMMLAVSSKLNNPVMIAGEKVDEKPILLMPTEKVKNGSVIC